MKRNSLPKEIVFLAVLMFTATMIILWASLFSVRLAMNREAAHESQKLMSGRIVAMQEQVALIASDYHNWTDIYLNAHDLNFSKLASNYGITAARGDIFEYAEIFDGPFERPVSWREGQGLSPQAGFLDDTTRSQLRKSARRLDISERETVNFFASYGENLIMFSSSYLLPEDASLLQTIDVREEAIATIGKVLPVERLDLIAQEFSLGDLGITTKLVSPDMVSVPAIGVTGKPVAWFEWRPPTPGSVLFAKMVPIMVLVTIIFAGVLAWGSRLLGDRAAKLITQEAISFDQARTDALTLLPNRFALLEHLEHMGRRPEIDYAAIAIDIDRFKQINDTIGHIGGDKVLRTFAARIAELKDDDTFIARLGGDEFLMVIGAATDIENVVREKLKELIQVEETQIRYRGVWLDVHTSKGIAILKSENLDINKLLYRADQALQNVKSRRTKDIIFYDETMEAQDLENRSLEIRLRQAIKDKDEFSISYQRIVSSLGSAGPIRYEALARWKCKSGGNISPEKFITIAETHGLILDLGWVLLDLICRDIAGRQNIRVCVNVSPLQISSSGFADLFAERVIMNGVHPDQIEIEVTEQIAVRDSITIFEELAALRKHGFRLALDDFGTGYASIGYLTRTKFDVLKIDRSLTRFDASDTRSKSIVDCIMGLAHAMKIEVVAEGIETAEQADRFKSLGADFMQGYYFGKPGLLESRLDKAS